jgi:hypothetical protein
VGEDEDNLAWFVTPNELMQPVVLDEYLAERWPSDFSESAEADRIHLVTLALSGDEWWTWLSGTEPLMQSGGLALVRAGSIVWARRDWLS